MQSVLGYMIGRLTIGDLEQSGGILSHVWAFVPVLSTLQLVTLLGVQF
jgi:hypothetical protein